MPPTKPTKERILDAAEAVFAERGYDAASLGDVADRVGIRPQAIYNHYKGKWTLYVAVMERLLDPLLATLDRALEAPPTAARRDASLAAEVALHARNPNLARLVQYATLGGGEPLELLKTRWYRPFFQRAFLLTPEKNAIVKHDPALLPWVITGFHNLVLGYATMAPLTQELLGIDPFSTEGAARQTEFLQELNRLVFEE